MSDINQLVLEGIDGGKWKSFQSGFGSSKPAISFPKISLPKIGNFIKNKVWGGGLAPKINSGVERIRGNK